jgi:hypothetical protein
MQASKIKPDFIYAIEEGNQLLRFRVTSVNTKRVSSTGSPHDYQSEVEGHLLIPDGEKGKPITRTLKPERILGEYTQYTELVTREAAEKAAAKVKDDERKALTQRLYDALYRLTGIEPPDDGIRGIRGPFRLGYGGQDIVIQFEGVEPLLKALEAVKESA